MAHADDMALFSPSAESTSQLLILIPDYLLKSVGMALSVGNSLGFFLHRRGDTWVSVPAQLSVRGEPIRSLGVGQIFTCLGVT